jgi:hypothetical protein
VTAITAFSHRFARSSQTSAQRSTVHPEVTEAPRGAPT